MSCGDGLCGVVNEEFEEEDGEDCSAATVADCSAATVTPLGRPLRNTLSAVSTIVSKLALLKGR